MVFGRPSGLAVRTSGLGFVQLLKKKLSSCTGLYGFRTCYRGKSITVSTGV